MMLTFPFACTAIVVGPTKPVTKPVAPALFQSAAVTVRVHCPTSFPGTALVRVTAATPLGMDTTNASARATAEHRQTGLHRCLPMTSPLRLPASNSRRNHLAPSTRLSTPRMGLKLGAAGFLAHLPLDHTDQP